MCPTVELSLIELWLLHFPFKRERNQQSSLQSILSQGLSKDYIKSNGAKRRNKSPTSTPYNKKEVCSVTNSRNDKTYKTFPLLKTTASKWKKATTIKKIFYIFPPIVDVWRFIVRPMSHTCCENHCRRHWGWVTLLSELKEWGAGMQLLLAGSGAQPVRWVKARFTYWDKERLATFEPKSHHEIDLWLHSLQTRQLELRRSKEGPWFIAKWVFVNHHHLDLELPKVDVDGSNHILTMMNDC